MNLKSIFLFLFVSPAYLFGQTLNPSRVIVGSAINTLPTDGEAQNVPFIIWNSSTTDTYSPSMQIANPNGRLSIAIAKQGGDWGAIGKGDIVFRATASPRMIFNLNTNNVFNTRKVQFGTQQNNFKTLVVSDGDKVGMGTENFPSNDPLFRLYVNGGIKAQELKIELCTTGSWCDYVFDSSYKLMPLTDVKKFVTKNKHLPNMPSAETLVKEEGFELGKITTLQQEKIEEIFLHLINLEEKVKKLEKENVELNQIINNQKK